MSSFEGVVRVYDDIFYVNTSNGIGVDEVVSKMMPLLFKISRKFQFGDLTTEESVNELVLIVIDGIKSFNPKKGSKLSSFLHLHLNNRSISKIKTINKMSNDASSCKHEGISIKTPHYVARTEVKFSDIGSTSDKNFDPRECNSLLSKTQSDFEKSESNIYIKRLCDSLDSNTANLVILICNGYGVVGAAKELNINPSNARKKIKALSKNKAILELLGL